MIMEFYPDWEEKVWGIIVNNKKNKYNISYPIYHKINKFVFHETRLDSNKRVYIIDK